MSNKTLFLQQSYNDCTELYTQILGGANLPLWDYIVLTASNEGQAASYRAQIDYRLEHGMLPVQTHYAVLPDPDGKRVGSGGATLNVLRYVYETEAAAGAASPADAFHKRILVIHSGGDSKRVPQYSACGKLFSPVPRTLPNGHRSTLFDEFMISMCGVAGRMNAGMLVCSGDVLLLFNPLQIDFYSRGAAALTIKEPVEIGQNHGVYRIDENGNVGGFLHKKTPDQLRSMGAVDEHGRVDIDTGAVILDSEMLVALYGLIDTDEKFAAFVNEEARISFYADFTYPLASDSTLEQYYQETPEGEFTQALHDCRTQIWEALHGFSMKLIRMSPAAFIHFGTTRELLHLMTDGMEEYRYLGWEACIHTNRVPRGSASSGSYISTRAQVGTGSYIEDSYVHHGSVIGSGCVISGVTLDGQTVPDGTVLHGLKLADGKFVCRMYGVQDNPKEHLLFGHEIEGTLWESPLYPVCDSMQAAVDATLARYAGLAAGTAESVIAVIDHADYNISLKDSFNNADMTAILPWQDKLADKVKVEYLLEVIDRQGDVREGLSVFDQEMSARAESMLLEAAHVGAEDDLAAFGRRIRIYYALSLAKGREAAGERTARYYSDRCFQSISGAVLGAAVKAVAYDADAHMTQDEVIVRLPVRVNWGGGWSDTPPYCMEHGGTVLNAAIALDGDCPIEAVVRRIPGEAIVLASTDSSIEETFTDLAALQDSSNPYDPYALHKAALIACGIIPYPSEENEALSAGLSVADITRQLGGGFYLSTRVINIPRGSGLGTSSILAGACVKAIYQMLGRVVSSDELYDKVLCMEQIMSTGGGWQDQVGGLAPGIKMVTSDAGIRQRITCTPCNISEETLQELDERFVLIYSGQRRLARNLLRDVVGRYVGGVDEAVSALYEIQQSAVLMRFELEKGNVDGFARLLSEHWELSKQLDSGCTNTCIEMIFTAIEDLIDGRMICGAGGGGFLQVVMKQGVTSEQLRTRLHEVFGDSGVDVWDCTFTN